MESAGARRVLSAQTRGIGLPATTLPMVAIIDRDRLTAYGLALLLRDWGYDTVAGTTAGEIFGRTEAKGAPIAAIVADDRREDGTTGGKEATALSALACRAIPTVVLGGDAAEAPGLAHMPKPVEPIRLRDLLQTMIRIGP